MRLRRHVGRVRWGKGRRRSLVLLLFMALFMLSPMAPASAGPFGPDTCSPADAPSPEAYGSGTDGLIKPPDYPSEQLKTTAANQLTYYDRYGTAGQTWYAVDMGCGDAMSLMGNSVANTIFTLVRAVDRTTISVYQAAASESLLGWLKDTVDDVISGIGKTFNARYWTPVVILGALTLAWWGLVRRRTSKVAEGTIWMVVAMVGLIWLISRPGDFTTLGTTVSNATSAAFNAALPQSGGGSACIPAPEGQPTVDASKLDATTRNANGLWVALVCKPWLMGEFGTTDPEAKVVKEHADKLLYSQAVDLAETYGTERPDMGAKSDAYQEVAKNLKEDYPSVYPLFQGKQWTSRLAVAFGALFAALVAGLLILVISVTLIIVKIAFLLLLVAGPIFLGIGIHPGIGRVIAVRWLELLLSMLLKQAALIGVLALLLWAYGVILGEGLPWGLQIMLIALVTGAAFVYRKPFQHLFAAVGYSAVSRARSESELEKSIATVRKNTLGVAQAATPGTALSRLVRREGGAPALAGISADEPSAPATAGGALGTKVRVADPAGAGSGRAADTAPPLNLPTRRGVAAGGGGGGAVAAPRGSGRPAAGAGAGRPASGGRPPARKAGASGTAKPTTWGERPEPKPASKPAPTPRPKQGGGAGGGIPRPRPAAPASAPRDQAPPLWAKRVADTEPPAPFWSKPVESDD